VGDPPARAGEAASELAAAGQVVFATDPSGQSPVGADNQVTLCELYVPGRSTASKSTSLEHVSGGGGRFLLLVHRKELRRRYCDGRWWPSDNGVTLFDPGKVGTSRYRYRGAVIPTPWPISA
jgi:hypothetical protein